MDTKLATAPQVFHQGEHHAAFDEVNVLHQLQHYLPSQTPLKDFIHHNSLHAFQHQRFYDGIFRAASIFGYQVTLQLTEYRELYATGRISDQVVDRILFEKKGADQVAEWKQKLITLEYDASVVPRIGSLRAQWKKFYHIDLDNLVQPLLFRILSSYLDQGISLWKFPVHPGGLLASVRQLESNSHSSFFKKSRARRLLLEGECTITQLLEIIVGDERFYSQYLFDQQFSHQGWSGIVASIEAMPQSLLDRRQVSLHDLVLLELLMEIDALDDQKGEGWRPLAGSIKNSPQDIFRDHRHTELNEVLSLWQDAFEWSYYDQVLAGIAYSRRNNFTRQGTKSFQAFFCIDERECSLRRHIEAVDPDCETLGTPGFFGVEFYFKPDKAKFYDKLCPAPVTPVYLIRETGVTAERKHELLYSGKTHNLLEGIFSSVVLGFWAFIRLAGNLVRPKMSPAISNAFTHMTADSQLSIENKDGEKENGLQVGFTINEMAARVEGLLRGVGMIGNFAPLVYVIAHGSSSANNPHHGAHDCGACSGRPGSVNSRVFAFMANHPEVRKVLAERQLVIPQRTQFVGGLHDTAADQVEFYDEETISDLNRELHQRNKTSFEKALDLNAKERSRRFASIDTRQPLKKVRKAILDRSVSMFEPRPELGHGTNSLCIVGSRDFTRSLFLDRRAFLNSYSYKNDPDGKFLTGIMKPLGPVCGGINLEYYFSRVDNYKLGAGTKLPHNVMGLIGVANSSDGDLRPGLPVQMIEVHDPVRLMIIVEHFPAVVLSVIKSVPEMYEWYINEWIHLVAVDPVTNRFYYFKNGEFEAYETGNASVKTVTDIQALVEGSEKMATNYIVDATKENLPVYSIN